MPTKRQRPNQRQTQKSKAKPADDFVSVARRLGCDEDKAQFEAKLAKIARSSGKQRRGT